MRDKNYSQGENVETKLQDAALSEVQVLYVQLREICMCFYLEPASLFGCMHVSITSHTSIGYHNGNMRTVRSRSDSFLPICLFYLDIHPSR